MLKGTKNGWRSSILRALTIILALVMVAGSLPASAASAKTVEVKSKKKLLAEIAKSDASTITFTTQKAYKFTIPAVETSSNKKIVINAPNATLTNKSSLKNVTINGIKKFTEKGSGNSITVKADDALINVEKGVDVKKLTVSANKVSVDIKGKAKIEKLVCNLKNAYVNVTAGKKTDVNITLSKKTKLTIAGEKSADVDILSKAKNSYVKTSIPVSISAEKNLKLKLNKGAEGSVVDSKNDEIKLSVSGKAAGELTEKVAGEIVKEPEKKDEAKEKTEDKKEEKKDEKKAAESESWTDTDSSYYYTDPNLCSDETTLLSRLNAYKDTTYDVRVTLRTNEESQITIPEGNYPGVTLVVDAPKATITNNATYKKVEIYNISSDTWVEKAIANIIALFAPKPHIVIAEGGSGTSLEIGAGVNTAVIENNGIGTSIQNVSIKAAAVGTAVRFTGTNNIPFAVKNESAGAVLTTAVQINLSTVASVKLQVLPGGENTEVVCKKDEDVDIHGVGNITVTNEETGEVYEVTGSQIEDEALKEELAAVKGKILGYTRITSGSAISATVSVYNYSSGFSAATATPVLQKIAGTDGSYALEDLPFGNYILIFSAEGYMNAEAIVPLINAETNIGGTVLITDSDSSCFISGELMDSVTGEVVKYPGVTIKLRKGLDNVSGTAYRTVLTNESGEFSFDDIAAGYYTVQVADTRTDAEYLCVRTYQNVVVEGGTTKYINITVNLQKVKNETTIGEGELQFVLGWGKYKDDESVPEDLDSHLTGPTADLSSRFHIYYENLEYTENGTDYADLDLDDVDYEGPETTTVRISSNGVYHFYVYNFTDGEADYDSPNYSRLSSSEAWVKVYRGTKELGVYHVPIGKTGTIWDVCTYDMNTNSLKLINDVYIHPGYSEDVGEDLTDFFLKKGLTLLDVSNGGNIYSWFKPEDEEEHDCIYLYGEDENIGADPVFTFKAGNLSMNYQADESGVGYIVGKLTVTFAGVTRIYNVNYQRATRAFDKLLIDAQGLLYTNNEKNVKIQFINNKAQYYVGVYGDVESISDPKITFVNKDGVTYTYESVEGQGYIGIIHATYKSFMRDIAVYMIPETEAFNRVMIKDSEYPIEDYIDTVLENKEDDPYKYSGYVKLPSVTGVASGPSISFMNSNVEATYTPAESGVYEDYAGKITATYGKFTCEIDVLIDHIVPKTIEEYLGNDADSVIEWKDNNLKLAVAEKLQVASSAAITVKQVYGITTLDISGRNIEKLDDLEKFVNLRYLNASNNNIRNAYIVIDELCKGELYYVDLSGNYLTEDETTAMYEELRCYMNVADQKIPAAMQTTLW
ncbi:MAG: hypothetical protein K6E95_08370 [Lachnospiraceae bacterium]|nr:hypothetical protein [Lachnospiraceae bacterium]